MAEWRVQPLPRAWEAGRGRRGGRGQSRPFLPLPCPCVSGGKPKAIWEVLTLAEDGGRTKVRSPPFPQSQVQSKGKKSTAPSDWNLLDFLFHFTFLILTLYWALRIGNFFNRQQRPKSTSKSKGVRPSKPLARRSPAPLRARPQGAPSVMNTLSVTRSCLGN